MRVPLTIKTERFYVVTDENWAYSSWASLEEAEACVARFNTLASNQAKLIAGVLRVNSSGRSWAWKRAV